MNFVYEHNFPAMEITPIRTVQIIKTDNVYLPYVFYSNIQMLSQPSFFWFSIFLKKKIDVKNLQTDDGTKTSHMTLQGELIMSIQ